MNTFALLRNAFWTACLSIALIVLFTCVRSANAQSPQPIFPTANPSTVNGHPAFSGDFNGDGKPDLAFVIADNSPQYSLGILLSVGSNAATTVTMPLCPNTGGFPFPVVNFADVNNDKKLDLVFSCNGYLTVQLGNGDGTFQTPAYFAITSASPVFADLNGDGYLDIATFVFNSSPAVSQVAVFLNKGATSPGVFTSPKLYALPSSASRVAAGDFNGDGKQDLVTTVQSGTVDSTYSGFSILYGNGDGTLQAANTQSMAPFYNFTAADFNGDGVTDLAFLLVANPNSPFTSVKILLGSPSGTFSQGAALPLVVTPAELSLPSSTMAAVALTSDGNLDLVVTTNVLNIFRGDGKGGFTPTGSYAVTGNPLLFADVNGDGKQDLIPSAIETFIFPGNGDGTFQAPPGTPVSGPVADLNNDGVADMVFFPPFVGSVFGTALGRGDGTFAILDQTTSLPAPAGGQYYLVPGDFNADGKMDTVAIDPGGGGDLAVGCSAAENAQLLSYLGSGDGRFQAKGTALALRVRHAGLGVTGDFNSDGKLDLLVPYGVTCQPGLLFVPGNGDGTFGTPIDLNASQNTLAGLLVADLNNDKKLDFIWGAAVFLGNGDGTFKQIPLTIPANPAVAVADLNGDGIPDAVSGPDTTIYAGKGDGTFETTPFYSVPTGPFSHAQSLATGDVNGDGNPDLLIAEVPSLGVFLGDGHGNFTLDTKNYLVSTTQSSSAVIATVPTRLNNQAPALAHDNKLDILIAVTPPEYGGATYEVSLINKTNPAPVKPAPLTSTTALQTSLATATPDAAITLTASVFGNNPTGSVSFAANGNALGTEAVVNETATLPTSFANAGSYTVTATYAGDSNNTASTSSPVGITITPVMTATTLQATPSAGKVNGQITLKATVSGDNPAGSVSFAAGTTSLGTATLTNGVAALQTSFAAAGSYATTATYQGDQNNAVSTSTAVTIVIAAPDFTVTATPASGTVPPGQTATFTFTVTPAGGYSGTLKFSCGPLPAQAACSF
jgi:hypothetical protein